MSSPPEPRLDLDKVIQDLRSKVQERESRGEYPPDLEDKLASHFRRVASSVRFNRVALDEQLRELRALIGLRLEDIPVASRIPLGSLYHRLTRKLIRRQIQPLADHIESLERIVSNTLDLLREESGTRHTHDDLATQIDTMLERLAAYERTPSDSRIALGDLRRRVEDLERIESGREFHPWFSSARFEEDFQGGEEDYRAAYLDLAKLLAEKTPVLDLGCGRGRFLNLLLEAGADAKGIDLDPEQVRIAGENKLPVEQGDALSYLAGLQDGTVGAAALLQVAEHLSPQQLVDLVALLGEKLKGDGIAVIESPNPASLFIYAHNFYIDPTHTQPVHPAYLAFLFKEARFKKVEVKMRAPVPTEVLLEEGTDQLDGNVERLNSFLFAPQNYALIAVR